MKRLRLNAVSPTRDDATSGQKSPWRKALTRTVWIAPALGVTTLAVLLILFSAPDLSHGQSISDTQVTLSCNDGHSVIFEVDQTTLTSLLADVQAINASGTGTSCTLTMAAPLKRDCEVDGLRLQPFKSSARAAELTQLNAGDHNGHHNYVPIQSRYLHRTTHHDRPELDRRSLREKSKRYDHGQWRRHKLHDSAQRRRLRVQRPCCREVLLPVPVRFRAKHGYTPSGFLHSVLVVESSKRAAGERKPNTNDNGKHD